MKYCEKYSRVRRKKIDLALWLGIPSVVVLVLWLGVGCFLLSRSPDLTWNEIGDAFGTLNSLFSGMALIGVVVAIYLQQKELEETREELRISAKAQTESVRLMEVNLRESRCRELVQRQPRFSFSDVLSEKRSGALFLSSVRQVDSVCVAIVKNTGGWIGDITILDDSGYNLDIELDALGANEESRVWGRRTLFGGGAKPGFNFQVSYQDGVGDEWYQRFYFDVEGRKIRVVSEPETTPTGGTEYIPPTVED